MPSRTHRKLALMTLALWGGGLLGCTPRPLGAPVDPALPALGEVRLVLGAPDARTTQWMAPASRARIRVDGPGMAAPIVLTADLSSEATATVVISSLMAGGNRIVSLDRLDAAGDPIPGGRVMTTVDIPAAGIAEATIGRHTTPRGVVFERVLAGDRAVGTHVAETLDDADVQALVEEVIRKGATYPDLVDAEAIASDVIAAGQVPGYETRYVLYPATLDVSLEGIPAPAPADVWLDDPLSPKNVALYGGTHRITPAAPGTWVLHARSAAMGVEATRSITLHSNQSAAVSVNLGAPLDQVKAPMPVNGMASAFGILPIAGEDLLLAAGGLKRITDSNYYHTDVWAYDGLTWTQKASLPQFGAYAQGAILGSDWYVTGGIRPGDFGLELTSEVFRFNGEAWAAVQPLPQRRGSAAVAALGNHLFVIGGFKNATWGPFGTYPERYDDPSMDYAAGFNATESFRYDPAADAWTPMPTGLRHGRGDAACAAVNGRIYVFGGQEFTDDAGSYMQLPLDTVESADASGIWRQEAAMPTPRGGAAAVVANGRIYVIGGCSIGGIPLGSVEVFDPATGRWTIKAPLRRARGYVAAGFLRGRIVVAGGGDGGSAGLEGAPLDTVESFEP